MFSYYGSKSKVVHLYPSPKYGKIIEPFAGSARYSLRYFDRDITLVDKYGAIVDLWLWLQQASEKDILGLPDVDVGDDIRKFNLCDGARLLMGFCVNCGSVTPKNIVCEFQNWKGDRARIAKDLYKIRHWKIIRGSFEEIPNQPATWFIDPPYQFGGEHYHETGIDFPGLAEWCRGREGQAIVCENTKANWLPFYPMRKMSGAYSQTTEAIWSNVAHDFMARQAAMFQ